MNMNMNTGKRNAAIRATVLRDDAGIATGLELVCATGETLAVHRDQLDYAIQSEALIHGLKQKLVDAAAISRNPDTGASASLADKWAAVVAIHDRLTGEVPNWNAERGTGERSTGGLLLRALVRMYAGKRTEAELRAFLASRSPADHASLRRNARVAAVMDEIRAESGGADSEELLEQI